MLDRGMLRLFSYHLPPPRTTRRRGEGTHRPPALGRRSPACRRPGELQPTDVCVGRLLSMCRCSISCRPGEVQTVAPGIVTLALAVRASHRCDASSTSVERFDLVVCLHPGRLAHLRVESHVTAGNYPSLAAASNFLVSRPINFARLR